jgi:hypothetical protein
MATTPSSFLDKAYKTAPIITAAAVIVGGGLFLYFQYKRNLLDNRLAAMQILKLEQDTGYKSGPEIVDAVLKGDKIVDIASKIA